MNFKVIIIIRNVPLIRCSIAVERLKETRSNYEDLQTSYFDLEKKLADLRIIHSQCQRRESKDSGEAVSLRKRVLELEDSVASIGEKNVLLESQVKDVLESLEHERASKASLLSESKERESRLAQDFASYKKRAQQILSERGEAAHPSQASAVSLSSSSSGNAHILELEQKYDILVKDYRQVSVGNF